MKNVIYLILFVFTMNYSYAALNGNYTINPLALASSTNYQSFLAAVSDLTLGTRTDGGPVQGPNVTGPVTVNISSGIYIGKLPLTTIGGTSATNRILFRP